MALKERQNKTRCGFSTVNIWSSNIHFQKKEKRCAKGGVRLPSLRGGERHPQTRVDLVQHPIPKDALGSSRAHCNTAWALDAGVKGRMPGGEGVASRESQRPECCSVRSTSEP